MKISDLTITKIATEAARNVASPGSVSGEYHNVKTIKLAIEKALKSKKGKR